MPLPGFSAESSLSKSMGYRTVEARAAGSGGYQVYAQRICPPWDPGCQARVCAPYCTPCLEGRAPQRCVDESCRVSVNCAGTLPELCDCYCSTGRFTPPSNVCIGPNDPYCFQNCWCLVLGKPCPAPGCNCWIV